MYATLVPIDEPLTDMTQVQSGSLTTDITPTDTAASAGDKPFTTADTLIVPTSPATTSPTTQTVETAQPVTTTQPLTTVSTANARPDQIARAQAYAQPQYAYRSQSPGDWSSNFVQRLVRDGYAASLLAGVVLYDTYMTSQTGVPDWFKALRKEEYCWSFPSQCVPEASATQPQVFNDAAIHPGPFYKDLLSKGYRLEGNASAYLQAYENGVDIMQRMGPGGLLFTGNDASPIPMFGTYSLNGVMRPITEGEFKTLSQQTFLPYMGSSNDGTPTMILTPEQVVGTTDDNRVIVQSSSPSTVLTQTTKQTTTLVDGNPAIVTAAPLEARPPISTTPKTYIQSGGETVKTSPTTTAAATAAATPVLTNVGSDDNSKLWRNIAIAAAVVLAIRILV